VQNTLPKIGILVFLIIGLIAANDMFFRLEMAMLGFATMSPAAAISWFIKSSLFSIVVFGISLLAIIRLVGMVTRKESVHKPNYDAVRESALPDTAQPEDASETSDFDADAAFARYMDRRGNSASEPSPSKPEDLSSGFGRKGT
jgi:hypothetical protein